MELKVEKKLVLAGSLKKARRAIVSLDGTYVDLKGSSTPIVKKGDKDTTPESIPVIGMKKAQLEKLKSGVNPLTSKPLSKGMADYFKRCIVETQIVKEVKKA